VTYQQLAIIASLAAIVLSGVALFETFLRALRRHRTIHDWITYVDGPLTTTLFLIAVVTLVSAWSIGTPDYITIGRFVMNTIRGLVIASSLLILGHFWANHDLRLPRWRR